MKFYSRWFWCVYCPCGYKSDWYRMEWLAHIIAFFHSIFSGHKIGCITVAACDVGKIESQIEASKE